jgi:methylated-DNA-[protein]-cysteine S-methyltransferase
MNASSKIPVPPPLLASTRGTPFERAVWSLTYQIPAGSFSTYALLAAHLKSSPRAVGNALRRNPFAPEIPWYVLQFFAVFPPYLSKPLQHNKQTP